MPFFRFAAFKAGFEMIHFIQIAKNKRPQYLQCYALATISVGIESQRHETQAAPRPNPTAPIVLPWASDANIGRSSSLFAAVAI